MSGLYPTEAKSSPPPTYEQATYYSQAPPIGSSPYIGTQIIMYRDVPIRCTCPHCNRMILTRIQKKTGLLPWLVCGGIAFLGCIFGCCLIPFCIDSLKDTEHYCPNCGVFLGAGNIL